MSNVIKLKRGSGSDPEASDMVVGEPVLRTDTAELFFKKDNGVVTKVSGGGSANTDIVINTLSSSSATGGGSATFNGSAYRFTLSDPPDTSVFQLLVSINGVVQKPNSGTSQPSEGFAVDGTDIIFGAAPPTGSPFFIITFKTVGVNALASQATVSTSSSAKSVKNITTSTSAPTNSNGVDGDLWFTYIA